MLYYTDACKKKKDEKKRRLTHKGDTRGAVLYKERATNSFPWPACARTVRHIQLVNLQVVGLAEPPLPIVVFRVPPLASNLRASGVRALKLPLARIELLTQSKVQIFPKTRPKSQIMTFSDSTQQQRGGAAAATINGKHFSY